MVLSSLIYLFNINKVKKLWHLYKQTIIKPALAYLFVVCSYIIHALLPGDVYLAKVQVSKTHCQLQIYKYLGDSALICPKQRTNFMGINWTILNEYNLKLVLNCNAFKVQALLTCLLLFLHFQLNCQLFGAIICSLLRNTLAMRFGQKNDDAVSVFWEGVTYATFHFPTCNLKITNAYWRSMTHNDERSGVV